MTRQREVNCYCFGDIRLKYLIQLALTTLTIAACIGFIIVNKQPLTFEINNFLLNLICVLVGVIIPSPKHKNETRGNVLAANNHHDISVV
jgi:hypothetical protein